MAPILLLATASFVAFLVVLALIAYAAFRFAAKREGPPLGAAGGCALAAVLLGAAFLAVVGFIVFLALTLHRANHNAVSTGVHAFDSDEDERLEDDSKSPFWKRSERTPLVLPHADPHADSHDDIRKY